MIENGKPITAGQVRRAPARGTLKKAVDTTTAVVRHALLQQMALDNDHDNCDMSQDTSCFSAIACRLSVALYIGNALWQSCCSASLTPRKYTSKG